MGNGYGDLVRERWAYLGPEGTFTEQAVRALIESAAMPVEPLPSVSVGSAIADLRAGLVDGACVPLENTVEGSVPLTLDELTHGEQLMIGAEAFVTVRLDVLVRPGTSADDVATVGSHPHGHAQVRAALDVVLPNAERIVTSSTAESAAMVARGELDAGVASPAAGARYGLVALAEDVGEQKGAVTRFVLLRRPGPNTARTGNDRTSLVVFVENRPGTLLAVLSEFANRGINLTRLESRPARTSDSAGGAFFEYYFLLDADGHVDDPAMADAIGALHRRAAGVRFLGSYPRALGRSPEPPDFASDAAYAESAAFVRGLLDPRP